MDKGNKPANYFLKTIFFVALVPIICLTVATINSLDRLYDTSVHIQHQISQDIGDELNQTLESNQAQAISDQLAIALNDYAKKYSQQKRLIIYIFLIIVLVLTFVSFILAKRQAFKATLPIDELANKSHNTVSGSLAPIELTGQDASPKLAQIVTNINDLIDIIKTKNDQIKELQERLSNQEGTQVQTSSAELTKLQEQLDKTSKLALVGEISSHVVHEVLNPLTGMLFQIQKRIEELSEEDQEVIGELRDVIRLWQNKFRKGELLDLLNRAKGQRTIGEHSFELILAYLRILAIEKTEMRERFKFLEKGIYRIIDILNLLKQKNKKEKLLEKDIDIRKIIQESYTFMAEKLKNANIAFIEEYEPNLPHLTSNSGELVEIILNLLQNAYQAIQKNATQGKIIVTANKKDDFLEIRVKDTGNGLSIEAEEKLFDFGFTTKKTGSGIGLALCKRILKTYGGDIILEENASQADFTVFLVKISLKEPLNNL